MIRHRFGGHLRAARRGFRRPPSTSTRTAFLEGIAIEGLEERSGVRPGKRLGGAQLHSIMIGRVLDRSDLEEERF